MSVDITTLGLEIKSDGAVTASKRLRDLEKDAGSVEKSFGKTGNASTQLTSKLMKLAGVVAGIFTLHKAKQSVIEITHLAGAYDMLGVAMYKAGGNAGYSAYEMDKYEKILRKQGIAAIEARQTLTQLSVAQIDLVQSSKLARAAQDLAVVGQINSSEAFERMTTAVQRGQTLMLRSLGLNVSFEAGYKKMADSIGIAVDDLTEQERVQSRVNTTLEAASKYQGIYELSMTSAEKQFKSLTRHVDDYKVAFGKAFQPAYLEIVKAQTTYYKEMKSAVSDPVFQQSLEDIGTEFSGMYSKVMQVISANLPEWSRNVSTYLKENKADIVSFAGDLGNIAQDILKIVSASASLFDKAVQGWKELPEIVREVGIVGAIIGGKKGLLIAMGAGILGDWAADLGKVFALAEQGIISWNDAIFSHDYDALLAKAEKMTQLERQVATAKKEYEKAFASHQKGSIPGMPAGASQKEVDVTYTRYKMLLKLLNQENESKFVKQQEKELKNLGPRIEKTIKLYELLGESTDLDKFVKGGNKQTTRPISDAAKKAIEDLKFETEMLGKSAKAQFIANQLRAAGAKENSIAGKEIKKLAEAYYTLNQAQEMANESTAQFMDFLSPADIKKAQDQMSDAEHALAQEKLKIWENTRNKIQDSMSGLFSNLNQADLGSFKDYMLDIAGTAGSISGTYFSEQFMKSIQSGDLQDLFSGGMLEDLFPDSAGEDIAAGLLGTIAAGINALASGNEFQMIGTALGAGIGAAIAGPLGMAVGSSIGNTVGSLFGGDDEPSYFSKLRQGIEDLIDQIGKNIDALEDSLYGTTELEKIFRGLTDSIKSDKIPGMEGSLAEELNLPGGMKKRKASGWDAFEVYAAQVIGNVASTVTGGLSKVVANWFTAEKLDKGYTAYDMGEDQLKSTMDAIFSSFETGLEIGNEKVIDLASAMQFFSQSGKDAGVFMDKMIEVGALNPNIPQRVVDWYSDGGGAKNIEEVSKGIAETIYEAVLEVMNSAELLSKDVNAYFNAFDTSQMSSAASETAAINKEIKDFNNEIALLSPTLITLRDSGELSERELAKVNEQLALFATSEAKFGEIRAVNEKKWADERMGVFKDAARSFRELTGVFTPFDSQIQSVKDTWQGFIDSFLDAGGDKESAGYAGLVQQQKDAVAVSLGSFWDDVLDTDGMSDYQIQANALRKTYSEYTQALKEQGLWSEMASEASEKFALKIKDLKDQFSESILKSADYIVATQGMTDLQKSIFDINKRYEEQAKILKEIDPAMVAEDSTFMQAWQIELRNAKEDAYSAIKDFYQELKTKIEDTIWDLQGGSLAPVQSMEGMNQRYQQLLMEAQSTGDVDKFTSFVTGDFAQFLKGYGNYSEVNQQIIKDMQMLETKLVDEASLGDLDGQLSTANTSLAEIVRQTTLLTETIMKTNGFAAGGYHSGGLRIVGERGRELEATGPSKIYTNNQLESFLSASRGQGDVTVIVKMGTKQFEDFTTETIRTNTETQKAVKRASVA